MATVKILDGDGVVRYVKASGTGTEDDPYIFERLDTNSAALLAATEAIQTAVEVLDNMIVGSEGQVDVVTVPADPFGANADAAVVAGAAGSIQAKLRLMTTQLDAIQTALQLLDNAIAGTEMQVDVVTLPGTVAADIAAIKTAVEILDNMIAGSEGQIDVVSSALPTGASSAANQATAITALGNLLTELQAKADLAETQPVSGTVAVTHAALTELAAAIDTEVQVDIVGALPAGTNTIGATRDAGPSWTSVYGVSGAAVVSADASTATAVTDAPTAGQKLVITDVIVSVGATAMQVDLEIETAGTVYVTLFMAANTTVQITPRGRWKLGTADKKLMVDTSAAGNIAVTAFYHSEI